jgi:hypothetical protein
MVEQISRLCESLATDDTLREVLSEAGVSSQQWHALETALTNGTNPSELNNLVERIIMAAENFGLDVIGRVREFQPLPAGSPGFRTVRGWICPHLHRCGRLDITNSTTPTCGVTGDPLQAVEGISG